MKVTLCDVDGCNESATLHVVMLDGMFKDLDFDACTFGHAERYHDEAHMNAEEGEDTA